jgi:signal transduction histidine kinase
MDLRRLRLLTIVAPISFLLALELISILLFNPLLGSQVVTRLLIIFAVLAVAVIPFSFWVFSVIERQHQTLRAANAEILRRNRELDAVNAAITAISSDLDLEPVFQRITDAARELVRCRYAALGVGDETGHLERFVTSGISQEQRATIGSLPQGKGLLGVLIREGKPVRIPDIGADPRRYGFPPRHPPMKSLLGVPVQFQDKVVGDLYLTEKIAANEFTDEDEALVMLLASHAAVAIENARLFEEVRTTRDRLQVWNQGLEAKVAERTGEIQRHSRELTTRVRQAQEEERKRIARELHDETAQSLSTMLITMDLLEQSLPQDNRVLRTGFDRLRTLTRQTLDDTRALSHDLRPTILDDVGLTAALYWFAEEFIKTFGVPIDMDIDEGSDASFSPEQELALFRIAQEALTNAGKYSGATAARASLHVDNGMARLVVEDNGRGFDPQAVSGPTRQGGLGLYGMKERAELLGGQLTIESNSQRGTSVTATVPVTPAGTDLVDMPEESEESNKC